jgi:hypothetical protein
VFIRIRGVLHYLWRAVDQHGVVLDILVQDRRNGAAAKRFFKHLLHGLQYKPRRLVTDGLRSYGVAQRAILPDVRHRVSAGQIIREMPRRAPPQPSAYGLRSRWRPPQHRSVAGAWACAWLSFRALKSKFPGVWCLIIIGTEGAACKLFILLDVRASET